MKTSKNSRKSQLYFIKTFGCQMNVSDSERIAGFLELHKCKPAKDINSANLVVFNTCGVRQMAEDRVYGQIHNLRTKNHGPRTKVILTGCLANRKDVQKRLKDKIDLFCEIKDFPQAIKKLLRHPMSKCKQNYLDIRPKLNAKYSAYIPIMTGCNNFCSYCVVPYARGREVSRSVEEINKEIFRLAQKNYKEVTLLGQNVNSYKYKKINFPKLLNNLAKKYPQINFNFLTSHPKDFSEKLMRVIAKNKNISREIHLPVQAGSDKILKAMNRPYTQKYYLKLIKEIKKIVPSASFTTDVIVGFPGETKKDFAESVKVFKLVGYNEAYINKYSPRPGTAAWKLKETVSLEEKKRREKILRAFVAYGKKK